MSDEDWKRIRGRWENQIQCMQDGVDMHVAAALEAKRGGSKFHLDRARALREEISLLKEWIIWQEP